MCILGGDCVLVHWDEYILYFVCCIRNVEVPQTEVFVTFLYVCQFLSTSFMDNRCLTRITYSYIKNTQILYLRIKLLPKAHQQQTNSSDLLI